MKVLHVVSIASEVGGAEVHVKLIRDSMQRQGHEVFVLSTDRNAAGKDTFADVMIPAVSGGSFTRLLKHFWNHDAYRKVRDVIHEFGPDIVHLHTITEFSPSLLWGIGETPTVLTVHGAEEFTLGLLPWFLAPSDYSHGSYRWEDIRIIGRLRYAYLRYMQRPAYLLALKRLKLIVAPSKYMARTIAGDFPRTPILHIYNGVVLNRKAPLPPPSSRPTVLYVGRLEAVKGVDYLIKAFAYVHRDFPESRLRIVGDGSQREALKILTKQLGLSDDVEFAGWVKHEQIHQEYVAATLMAIPSLWPENLPSVAIEAMAIGRPIVGTNAGGLTELIDTNVTGVLVEPADEYGLAHAMSGMISDRHKLIAAASASAVKAQAFDSSTFIENLLDVYQKVLDGAGKDKKSGARRLEYQERH